MKGGCRGREDRPRRFRSGARLTMLVLLAHTHARTHAHIYTQRIHIRSVSPILSFFFSVRTDGRRIVDVVLLCMLPGVTVYYRHLASRRRRRVVRSTRVVNVNAMTVCMCVFFRFLASRSPRVYHGYTLRSVPGRTHARTHACTLESPPRRVSRSARVLQSRRNRGPLVRDREEETSTGEKPERTERRRSRSCVLGSS